MHITEHGGFHQGDLVKITVAGVNATRGQFKAGHVARLLTFDTEANRWRANFNNKGNASVAAPGIWKIGDEPPSLYAASTFVLLAAKKAPKAENPILATTGEASGATADF